MAPDAATDQAFAEQQATINTRATAILERFPESRSSDAVLVQLYAREFEKLDLPIVLLSVSIASIIRERRRIQKNRPELKATDDVQAFRESFAKSYQDYYRDDPEPEHPPGYF